MRRRKAAGPSVSIRTLWGIAKSPELSLTDEELHLIAERETGKDSLRALTGQERKDVARVLQGMKDGAKRAETAGNPQTVRLRAKIRSLCEELGWEDPRRVNGMAKRVCGVERVEWLNVPQCIKLIEALKAMQKRRIEQEERTDEETG